MRRLAVLFSICLSTTAFADVRLPNCIGSNAVLQREMPVPIWGWADAGEKITVTILGQTKNATPEAGSGKWMVRLNPLPTGGPYTMTVQGKNRITLENLLVGEVWLCSGQSNMGMTVSVVKNAQEEIAAANFPKIRLLGVALLGTQEPQQDIHGQWAECSPKNVGSFSAAAYFFGRELYRNLNIPIGLINCSWGGSSCEAWVQRCLLEADPQYKALLVESDRRAATWDQAKEEANYQKALEKWKLDAAAAKKAGKAAPKQPRKPQDYRSGQHRPANLYNGMLLPLIPYAIRGAIWYQGETNAGRAYQYRDLFPRMIRSWRADWKQGDFPFYFVQLANYMAVKPEPGDSAWAELREAQSMSLATSHTGEAVIIDIGEAGDIHPKNKQDVGKRLALWALAKDYGKNVVYSGPTFEKLTCKGSQAVVQFDSHDTALAVQGDKLQGFAVAGEDKKFVWANARIEGNAVVCESLLVPHPVAVRYAWADNPICNLYNQAGLPASPFRTDDWPGITAKVDH